MVIEDSREYKAAQELERALNDYSWNPKRFAESTRYYHRTLQQELMRTIVAIIQMVGDESYGTDLRNQAHMNFAKRLLRAVHWMKPICRSYRLERNKGHH